MPVRPLREDPEKPKVEKGIRLIRPGVYEVRYGQLSRTTDGGIKAARNLRAKLITEVGQGKHGGTKATFGKLLDEWLSHGEKMGRSPTTLAGYRKKLVPIKEALGSIRLEKLTAHHIDGWYANLMAAGKSEALVVHYHRIIAAALHQGEKWGWIERDLPRLLSPPTAKRVPISPPPGDRVWALIQYAQNSRGSKEYAPFLLVAALRGMRRGELCGLRWSDVDWGKSSLLVERSVWQDNTEWGVKATKTHQSRTLPLGPYLLSALTARKARVDAVAQRVEVDMVADAYIFSPDAEGRVPLMPDTATQNFRRLCAAMEKRAAGESPPRVESWPWHLHDLRHYTATELFGAGKNPKTVAELLGHADASVTLRIYTHDTPAQAIDAAESLEAGLIPPPPKALAAKRKNPRKESHANHA